MNKSKIFITGSCGFIGSHLTEYLIEKGHKVKALVHYNSSGQRGWLEKSKYKNEIEFIYGDISDYDLIHKSISGCQSVFHLAALIGIPYSYISPKAYIRTNIEGTYNVLEASKACDLENVLITSTSETYGSAQYVPIDEKHPLVGQSPYSASKIAADQLALSYFKSFGTQVKIIRPFNTYGPRQSARAIIPTILTQIISGSSSINLGNLEPQRDLTYVKDTVSGFYEIFSSEKLFGEITNIGSNKTIRMSDLVTLITEITNSKIEIKSDNKRIRPSKSEVDVLLCDNEKILKNTNWNLKTDLREGLIKTHEFLKENIELYRPEEYNV